MEDGSRLLWMLPLVYLQLEMETQTVTIVDRWMWSAHLLAVKGTDESSQLVNISLEETDCRHEVPTPITYWTIPNLRRAWRTPWTHVLTWTLLITVGQSSKVTNHLSTRRHVVSMCITDFSKRLGRTLILGRTSNAAAPWQYAYSPCWGITWTVTLISLLD